MRYFSLGSSYQLPKDWSIKLEKKVKRTKKILCQIIAYERPSLDDKHVFQLLGLLLLQANHSKNATLQVTFFPSSTYLSLVVVFRILCTFLAIFFVKIKLKRKINIWYILILSWHYEIFWVGISLWPMHAAILIQILIQIDHCVSRAKVERLLFNDL